MRASVLAVLVHGVAARLATEPQPPGRRHAEPAQRSAAQAVITAPSQTTGVGVVRGADGDDEARCRAASLTSHWLCLACTQLPFARHPPCARRHGRIRSPQTDRSLRSVSEAPFPPDTRIVPCLVVRASHCQLIVGSPSSSDTQRAPHPPITFCAASRPVAAHLHIPRGSASERTELFEFHLRVHTQLACSSGAEHSL